MLTKFPFRGVCSDKARIRNSAAFAERLEARTFLSAAPLATVSSGGGASSASVAMAADGRFIVAYAQANGDGNGQGILARLYNSDGSPVAAPFVVDQNTAGDQISAQVAADAAGDFVVTWDDLSAGTVSAQRFNASGARIGGQITVTNLTLETTTDVPNQTPQVAMDAAGDFVVAWTISTDTQGFTDVLQSYYQQYNSSGAAVGGNTLSNYGTFASLSMNDQGDFAVATENSSTIYTVETSAAGNTLGSTRLDYANSAALALDNSGEYRSAITYSPGEDAIYPFLANGSSMASVGIGDGGGTLPVIAVDRASGASIAAFDEGNTVSVEYYDTNLNATTSVLNVNPLSGAASGGPAIAMSDPLHAAVAWVDSTSGDVVVRSLVAAQPTTVLSITHDLTRAAFSTSVSWKVTFADPFTGLSASNFQLAPSTLAGSPAITGVEPLDSGPVSANWEVTATTGTGGGTLGLNFVNSAGIEAPIVVSNTLVGGTYSFPFPQTLNPPAVFSSLTAPTITTAAGSDFITGSLSAGTYTPTGSVAIGIGGALVTAPIASDGSFSAQVSTTGLSAGLYPVRVSYGGDLTVTGATASVLMSVTPATAAFTNLITPTITDGAASATFTGLLASDAGTPSGNVAVTLDGATQLASLDSDGAFSATFSTSLLAVGSHSVQYSYAGDGVFAPPAPAEAPRSNTT